MGLFENLGKKIGEGMRPMVYRENKREYEVVKWRELSAGEWHGMVKSFAMLAFVSYSIIKVSPVAFAALAGFTAANGLSLAVSGKTFGEHYRRFKQRRKESGEDGGIAYKKVREGFDMQFFNGAPIIRHRGVAEEDVSGPDVVTLSVRQRGTPGMKVIVPRPEIWSSVPSVPRKRESVRAGGRRAA